MARISSDAPVTGIENSPDRLNRIDFAKRVADLAIQFPEKSGIVISLEGPWGYGKTSLVNLMDQQFKQLDIKKRPIIVRFNPWIVGNHEKLIQSFLIQIAAKIGVVDHAESGKKAAKELLNYSSIFTALKLIPGTEPFASIVKGVVDAVGGTAKNIAELKELDLDHRKEAVIKSLSALGRSIVVFIDDIDRLPSSEVFEIIRLVKAVGDFPSVTYVLCYDTQYVSSALSNHGIANASEYLDKIVQLRITLPSISRTDLVKIFNAEYDSLPTQSKQPTFPDVEDRIQELYFEALKFLLETPRDIKRLFNRLQISEPGCRGEINLGDLMGLETLAVKAPAIYEHIRTQPEVYVGLLNEDRNAYSIFHQERKGNSIVEERNQKISLLPERLRRHTQSLIEALFPLDPITNDRSSEESYRKEGRIAARDRLQIALAAGVPTDGFPYALATEFVKASDSRPKICEQAFSEQKLRQFFDGLSIASDNILPAKPNNYCQSLARLVDKLDVRNDAQYKNIGVTGSLAREVWHLVENVLSQQLPADRQTNLTEITSDQECHTVSVWLIFHLRRQRGFYGSEKSVSESEAWCATEVLSKLQSSWLQNTKFKAEEGTLFRNDDLRAILRLLAELDKGMANHVGNIMLSNEKNFDDMALSIAHQGTDSAKGRFAQITREFFEPFGNPDHFQNKANKRLEDVRVTGELRHSLKSIATGQPIYLKDGSLVRM